MKTELEEAAETIYDDNLFAYEKYRHGFIAGAKWQQERMFSEGEMKLTFETGRNFQLTGENNFKELVERFKKKTT